MLHHFTNQWAGEPPVISICLYRLEWKAYLYWIAQQTMLCRCLAQKMTNRKKSRGGARRQMVPPVDHAHLVDSLVEHVKKVGVQSSFALGKYANLEVQQAVVGPDLLNLLPLLRRLQTVQPTLEYKYSDLEQAAKKSFEAVSCLERVLATPTAGLTLQDPCPLPLGCVQPLQKDLQRQGQVLRGKQKAEPTAAGENGRDLGLVQ